MGVMRGFTPLSYGFRSRRTPQRLVFIAHSLFKKCGIYAKLCAANLKSLCDNPGPAHALEPVLPPRA